MKKETLYAGLVALIVLAGIVFWYFNRAAYSPARGQNQEINTHNASPQEPMPQEEQKKARNPIAVFDTSKGIVEIELFLDKAPVTAGNFAKLAKSGFYNGTKFHRVIKGFMIQGGDPNSKEVDASRYGTGGPGYTIQDEFVSGLSNVRGTISMANTGRPNSGGSQFFINHADNVGLDHDKPPLTSSHPVFGKVVKGMEVIDVIAGVETNANDIPLVPVTIRTITIRE